MEKKDIGPLLGAIARKKKISQTKIATEAGISRISVNRFFAGHTEVRVSAFIAICNSLGVDLRGRLAQEVIGGLT